MPKGAKLESSNKKEPPAFELLNKKERLFLQNKLPRCKDTDAVKHRLKSKLGALSVKRLLEDATLIINSQYSNFLPPAEYNLLCLKLFEKNSLLKLFKRNIRRRQTLQAAQKSDDDAVLSCIAKDSEFILMLRALTILKSERELSSTNLKRVLVLKLNKGMKKWRIVSAIRKLKNLAVIEPDQRDNLRLTVLGRRLANDFEPLFNKRELFVRTGRKTNSR